MTVPIEIHRGRTTVVTVGLGYNVSTDILTSQVRSRESRSSPLLATFAVTFLTNGTDGELILTLDDSSSQLTNHVTGFMDIKRISNGEPLSVFKDPIPVIFKDTVTA